MSLFEKYWLDSLVNILYSFVYASEGVTEKLINMIKLNLEHMPSQDLCKISSTFEQEHKLTEIKDKDSLLNWVNQLHNLFNQHLRIRHTPALTAKLVELNGNNPKFIQQPVARAVRAVRTPVARPATTGSSGGVNRYSGISIHRKVPPKKISTSLEGVDNAYVEQPPQEPVRVAKKAVQHVRMGIRRSAKPVVIYHMEKRPNAEQGESVEVVGANTTLLETAPAESSSEVTNL